MSVDTRAPPRAPRPFCASGVERRSTALNFPQPSCGCAVVMSWIASVSTSASWLGSPAKSSRRTDTRLRELNGELIAELGCLQGELRRLAGLLDDLQDPKG